jgi:hypothetical protein
MERVRRPDDISRPGQGRGVGGVLLGASVEEVLPDVEDDRCDRADRNEPPGEDDEDLPP